MLREKKNENWKQIVFSQKDKPDEKHKVNLGKQIYFAWNFILSWLLNDWSPQLKFFGFFFMFSLVYFFHLHITSIMKWNGEKMKAKIMNLLHIICSSTCNSLQDVIRIVFMIKMVDDEKQKLMEIMIYSECIINFVSFY